MKIFITGGTGFIGWYLSKVLMEKGHSLTIVTRTPEKFRIYESEKRTFTPWQSDFSNFISDADAIINLAGENLFAQRWTQEFKKKIRSSRINVTTALLEGINKAENKPKTLISASAVGYYGDQGEEFITEQSAPGRGFLAGICKEWEEEALKARDFSVRVVIPRIGIPLAKDGGALERMLTPFKYMIGGPVGSGNQYFPWVHIMDLCESFVFALENETFEGPYNATSPNPVTMQTFSRILGKVLNRPSWIPVPEFALRVTVGEAVESIISSLRVIPEKLLNSGFSFIYRDLDEALRSLLS